MVSHNRMRSCPAHYLNFSSVLKLTTENWLFLMFFPVSAICQEAVLGLQSDDVWRSGSTLATDVVYKESFGPKKVREMFYSSRSTSVFGEGKKN